MFWQSSIQSLQALSAAEAELNTLVSAVEEIDWIRSIVEGFDFQVTPIVLEDNQSVISMIDHPRTKKYQLRIDYIQERLKQGLVQLLKYMPSKSQSADVLTKVINKDLDTLIGLKRSTSCLNGGMLTY